MKYVAGLMFSEDKMQVAMVLKNRPAWQAGLFNVIGGKIENDEEAEVAMAREFLEETGVATEPSDWKYHLVLEGDGFHVTFFSMISDKVKNVRTMETETIQLVNPYNLPINTIQNLRWIIPMALDAHVIVPRIVKYR